LWNSRIVHCQKNHAGGLRLRERFVIQKRWPGRVLAGYDGCLIKTIQCKRLIFFHLDSPLPTGIKQRRTPR
jgi:hypothetical protein